MYLIAIPILFCSYCIASCILRLHPQLIHSEDIRRRKKRLHISGCSLHHISHRGGAGENLENTMTAFDHAYQLGTDMFELDCQMTKDGFPVVAHDNHLLRLCGEDVYINEVDLKDLPPLLCSQRLDFDHSFKITKKVPQTERRIILLEELFSKYPNMRMNVDIKTNNKELIKAVERLIVKYRRQKLTVWGNSSHPTTQSIRAANDQIATIFSINEVLKTVLLYYAGLLPFFPLYADYFEIPLCSTILENRDSFSGKTRTIWHRALIKFSDYLLTSRRLLEHLKKRGVPTYIFVLNTEQEWKRAVDFGVSGVMTDVPTKLKIWIKNNCLSS
ncbi:lysophospholipase D GDPD1-like [Watersipora subatra]|uniref:lysophospholipase D GDPD1-like n=1 Tax=Watersipora subatra TaxID=2589382 RepID=UPI00355C8736